MLLSYWYWYDIQPRSEQIKFRPFRFTCVVKHPIDHSIGFVFDFDYLFFQQKATCSWIFYLFWFQQLCYHFITHFEAYVSRMFRTKTRLGDLALRERNDSIFRRLPCWCEHCGGKTLSEAGSRKMFAMTKWKRKLAGSASVKARTQFRFHGVFFTFNIYDVCLLTGCIRTANMNIESSSQSNNRKWKVAYLALMSCAKGSFRSSAVLLNFCVLEILITFVCSQKATTAVKHIVHCSRFQHKTHLSSLLSFCGAWIKLCGLKICWSVVVTYFITKCGRRPKRTTHDVLSAPSPKPESNLEAFFIRVTPAIVKAHVKWEEKKASLNSILVERTHLREMFIKHWNALWHLLFGVFFPNFVLVFIKWVENVFVHKFLAAAWKTWHLMAAHVWAKSSEFCERRQHTSEDGKFSSGRPSRFRGGLCCFSYGIYYTSFGSKHAA